MQRKAPTSDWTAIETANLFSDCDDKVVELESSNNEINDYASDWDALAHIRV